MHEQNFKSWTIYKICEQFSKNHEHFSKIINKVLKFMTFFKKSWTFVRKSEQIQYLNEIEIWSIWNLDKSEMMNF
jgi:hypothetical protein